VALKTKVFDPAEHLTTDIAVATYLSEAMETGDPAFIADALGVVARARGMTRVARETGMARESLYRALDKEGNPELATIVRVINAIGLRLDVKPAAKVPKKPSKKARVSRSARPRAA
jgi:probable addiction module antidote protein